MICCEHSVSIVLSHILMHPYKFSLVSFDIKSVKAYICVTLGYVVCVVRCRIIAVSWSVVVVPSTIGAARCVVLCPSTRSTIRAAVCIVVAPSTTIGVARCIVVRVVVRSLSPGTQGQAHSGEDLHGQHDCMTSRAGINQNKPNTCHIYSSVWLQTQMTHTPCKTCMAVTSWEVMWFLFGKWCKE